MRVSRSTLCLAFLLATAACGGQFESDSNGIGTDAGVGGSNAGGSAGHAGAVGGAAGAGGAFGFGGAAGTAGHAAGAGGVIGVGGAAGAGGVVGVGGAAGAGGAAGDAGACVESTVTFQLKAPGGGTWCLGLGCSTEWLSIRDASGKALILSNYCQASCTDCIMVGCPAICAMPQPMPAAGATKTWNGTVFASSTCGAQSMSCLNKRCAPAGKYVAVMCATASGTPDSSLACANVDGATQTCVEVPFEYPSAAPVVGTIPYR